MDREFQLAAVADQIAEAAHHRDLAHDAHGIWELAFDCLQRLTIPSRAHPLAEAWTERVINHYCDEWTEAHLRK